MVKETGALKAVLLSKQKGDRHSVCCSYVGKGGLVTDRKSPNSPSRALLVVTAQGPGYKAGENGENLVFTGIDVDSLKAGDKLTVCPGTAPRSCQDVIQKFIKAERNCVVLTHEEKRNCGGNTTGAFFSLDTEATNSSVLCEGDKVELNVF